MGVPGLKPDIARLYAVDRHDFRGVRVTTLMENEARQPMHKGNISTPLKVANLLPSMSLPSFFVRIELEINPV